MTNFDFRAATSYVAAAAVALFSTTMIFAATAVPSVAHVASVVA